MIRDIFMLWFFQVTLAVIGLSSGQVVIFDLVTCPQIMTRGLLSSLIESKEIIKVSSFRLDNSWSNWEKIIHTQLINTMV